MAARKVAAQVPAAPKALQPRVTREGGATVREYTLEISEQVIDYGDGNAWTVWTYNGSVPGQHHHGKGQRRDDTSREGVHLPVPVGSAYGTGGSAASRGAASSCAASSRR